MTHPFSRLLLATEHTAQDAGAETLAFTMARRCGLPLRAVVPIASNPEYEAMAPQLAAHAEAQAGERIAALRGDAQRAEVTLELLALLPLYLRQRERLYAALCVAQVAVLLLAASGLLTAGH